MIPLEISVDELCHSPEGHRILLAGGILAAMLGAEAMLLARIVRKVRARPAVPFPDVPWTFEDMWMVTGALLPLLAIPLIALLQHALRWTEETAGLSGMWSDPDVLRLLLGSTAVLELGGVGVLLRRAFARHGLGWSELGLWMPSWREGLAAPLLAVGAFMGLEVLYERMLAACGASPAPQLVGTLVGSAASSRADAVFVLLAAGLAIPLMEELLFRGFLFPLFKRYVGVGWGMGISTFLFAVGHLEPLQAPGDWVSLALRLPEFFGLGFLLCWLFHRSGSLVPPMLAHVANNTVTVLLLLRGAGA